ncbi:MAG TPA: ferritin-like protein [Thermoanaerobaculia bacterium]|jgi:hypothetical protein
MIHLQWQPISTIEDAWARLQTAIDIELGTIPPYLYAWLSILPGKNAAAAARIQSVFLEEMIHLCLACNILNALGGNPVLTPPVYPGPLGDIGSDGKPLIVHLLRFSREAMQQGMNIETPENPIEFPVRRTPAAEGPPPMVTIGQFYGALDRFLATLPPEAWNRERNQIDDSQFFPGQIHAVNDYEQARDAIERIVSEGEGARRSPLDFKHELAHYYRFHECDSDLCLTKADNPDGYQWGPQRLGIDWSAVYPAIPDPGTHDFSGDPPAAQAAQAMCNDAYARLIDALQLAVTGGAGQLGIAVRAMFNLRAAAHLALTTPLADPQLVAGPSFLYRPVPTGAST